MNEGKSAAERSIVTIRAESVFFPEDPTAWGSGEVLRLILVPAIVAMLFVGGVYWIRWRLPAGQGEPQPASTVQVHLMTRPGPQIFPAPAPETSPANVARTAAPAQDTIDPPGPPAEEMPVAPAPPAPATRDMSVPINPPVPPDGPPSVAASLFRQALLRQVARYQRYPQAARRNRLYGSVDTIFSMRRDGTIVGIWVKGGSGEPIFDKEAMDTIRRAQPFPPVPRDLPDPLTVETTLVFEPS